MIAPKRPPPPTQAPPFIDEPDGDPLLRMSPEREAELRRISSSVVGDADRIECWDKRLADRGSCVTVEVLTSAETLYDWLRMEAWRHPLVTIRLKGQHKEQVKGTQNTTDTITMVDFDLTISLAPVYNTGNLANVRLQVADVGEIPETRTPKPPRKSSFLGRVGLARWVSGEQDDKAGGTGEQDGKAGGTGEQDGKAGGTGEQGTSSSNALGTAGTSDGPKHEKGTSERSPDALPTYSPTPPGTSTQPPPPSPDIFAKDWDTPPGYFAPRPQARADSSAALRTWCEAYCADPIHNKCLVMTRRLWGWDFDRIATGISDAVRATGYEHEFTLKWRYGESYVIVRPANRAMRVVQRVTDRLGVRYDAAQVCYGMKVCPPLPSTYPGETVKDAQARLPSIQLGSSGKPLQARKLQCGPRGVHYFLGRTEDEWLWVLEDKVKLGVRAHAKQRLDYE